MLSTNMFPPDAALPPIFDKTKDQKVIHKDTNVSGNSVKNLLVYSKYPVAQSLIFKNMVSTYMFPPDAVLPGSF